MASRTDGAGPKLLSFAPTRALKGFPRLSSSVSGPVKGTVEGKLATSGVRRGDPMAISSRFSVQQHVRRAVEELEKILATYACPAGKGIATCTDWCHHNDSSRLNNVSERSDLRPSIKLTDKATQSETIRAWTRISTNIMIAATPPVACN